MTDSIVDELRALQQSFIKELPIRLDEIEQAWQISKSTRQDEAFCRLIHSLAGSAGTFGFTRFGVRARDLDIFIQQQGEVSEDAEAPTTIERMLIELRELAQQGPDNREIKLPSLPSADRKSALIYLLEDAADIAEEISNQLKYFDYRVEIFDSADALQGAVARQAPGVLIADIHLQEGVDAGMQAVTELRSGAARDVPVIFISSNDSWQNRLNAVRAGAQAFLSKPFSMDLLLEQLDSILGNLEELGFRILIVDDNALQAEHYATVLQSAGMQTEVLTDPASILQVLPVFCPDLVLMDIYMLDCTGVEVSQVIRQHGGYTNLPIVYLSTEQALEQQLAAMRVGGDDFLQKPISDTHLLTAVGVRAQRFRELTALMTRDGLTGLYNHINLKLMLEREVAQAQRRSSPLCFAMLDIDHFKSVNDNHGHPAGDMVIKSLARMLGERLRKGDIASRYGGEEFAVILPDTKPQDARRVIDDLRQQFAQFKFCYEGKEFHATLSAGIATCPPHIDMEVLLSAADHALYQAKHEGRNQVVVDAGPLS